MVKNTTASTAAPTVNSTTSTCIVPFCRCGKMAHYFVGEENYCDDCYGKFVQETNYQFWLACLERARTEGKL